MNMEAAQKTETERACSRSHRLRGAPRSPSSPRLERLLLVLSYAHLFATLTASVLCFELMISGGALTHGTDFLSPALLPIGLLGPVNIPFLFWIRSSGVRGSTFWSTKLAGRDPSWRQMIMSISETQKPSRGGISPHRSASGARRRSRVLRVETKLRFSGERQARRSRPDAPLDQW